MPEKRTPRINRKSAKDDLVELLKNGQIAASNDYPKGSDLTHIYRAGILDAAKAAGIKIKAEDYAS